MTAQVGDDAASLVRARLSSLGAVAKAGEAAWLSIVGPRTCFYGADQKLLSWNLHLAARRTIGLLPSDVVFTEPPPAR